MTEQPNRSITSDIPAGDAEHQKQLAEWTARLSENFAKDPQLETKFQERNARLIKRDVTVSKLVFKTGLAAYTDTPQNLFLRGESSTGKTYVVVNTLGVFPKEDVWNLGGLSPKALVHDRGQLCDAEGYPIEEVEKPRADATEEEKEAYQNYREKLKTSHYVVDLQGKILVFLEAPNIETFNYLRPVLSHDVREISYKFVDSGKSGLRTRHVVLKGWPSTIFLTTSENYVQDLATRSITCTPEMAEEKHRAANILTGGKAAKPWNFLRNGVDDQLEKYIRYFKEHVKGLTAVVPYGDCFGEVFPAKFPRSMRDFGHIIGLIKVSALFNFAQRPILALTGRNACDQEETFTYVMATRDDHDKTMSLWQEVKESTETSANSQVLKLFHEVVIPMSQEPDMLLYVKTITDRWNSTFPNNPKSTDSIRHYLDFLCSINYMSAVQDEDKKSRNIYSVVQTEEKTRESPQKGFSEFFTLETFKAWLNSAKQIFQNDEAVMKTNLADATELTPEDAYTRFYSQTANSIGNIDINQKSAENAIMPLEKAEKPKINNLLGLKPEALQEEFGRSV